MAQNKKIFEEIAKFTENDKQQKDFLNEIFDFENEGKKKGWYENRYCTILEKYCKENKK